MFAKKLSDTFENKIEGNMPLEQNQRRLYSSNINIGSGNDYNTAIHITLDNYAFVVNKRITDVYTL